MTTDEIKDLVIFCKKERVKRFSHEGLEFEFSEISFVQANEEDFKNLLPLEDKEDDEDVLYHSAEG